MQCVEKFEQIYHREPTATAFCPYRICPMGAHSDHQLGKITGLAINRLHTNHHSGNITLIGESGCVASLLSLYRHLDIRLWRSKNSPEVTLLLTPRLL